MCRLKFAQRRRTVLVFDRAHTESAAMDADECQQRQERPTVPADVLHAHPCHVLHVLGLVYLDPHAGVRVVDFFEGAQLAAGTLSNEVLLDTMPSTGVSNIFSMPKRLSMVLRASGILLSTRILWR